MHSSQPAASRPNQVMALFADSALSFDLPKEATFADLAERLDYLGGHHIGTPMAVYLKFSMAKQPITAGHTTV